MRNLFAIRNLTRVQTQNITKQTKAIKPDGCGSQCTDYGTVSDFGEAQIPIIKDQCFCIDSSSHVTFLFAEGLRVEGYGSDGSKLGPVDNAWGVSTGYFKVTPTKTVNNAYYWVNDISLEPPLPIDGDWRHIAVFKDFDGKITSEVDIKDKTRLEGDLKAEIVYTIAPTATVTYETDDVFVPSNYYNVQLSPGSNDQKGSLTLEKGRAFVSPTDLYQAYKTQNLGLIENKKYEAEASATVTINKKPPFYPNKIFQMKPNQIYTDNVEEYEFLSGGGLSGGAIAGIVISCIVVVGVVVFCIVWFVVLKKGCCCGGEK